MLSITAGERESPKNLSRCFPVLRAKQGKGLSFMRGHIGVAEGEVSNRLWKKMQTGRNKPAGLPEKRGGRSTAERA